MGIYIRQTGRLNKIRDFGSDKPFYDNTLSSAGSFDVTGIPPSYNHIFLIFHARGDVTAIFDNVYLYLNNDTTLTNYSSAFSFQGTSAVIGQQDTPLIADIPAASSPAGYFSDYTIWIPNYTSGENKTATTIGGTRRDASNHWTFQANYMWENTAVINRITLKTDNDPTDQLDTNSSLQVWLYR